MAVTPQGPVHSFIFCSASNLLDLFCLPFNVSRNKYNQPSHILMISILHYDVWETRFYHSLLFSDFVVHIIFRIAAWFTSWYNFFVQNFLIYLCLPSAHFYLTFFYSVETFQYFIEILLTVVCFYLIVDTIFQNFYIHMTSKFCFPNVLL